MSGFSTYYTDLLIKQYWEKPKAKAHIELIVCQFEKVYNLFNDFQNQYDIDKAQGSQLDTIGKIVGLSRIVPYGLPKVFFGFSNNTLSKGFASKFDNTRQSAPFKSKFGASYSDLELNDYDYRFFLKVKIAKNNASAFLISDDMVSLQDVIMTAFENRAYVVDHYDMSMTLYVSPSFSIDRLDLILKMNLLPKPMGVRYNIVLAEPLKNFGFSNNANSRGFASKFDSTRKGGYFARRYIA